MIAEEGRPEWPLVPLSVLCGISYCSLSPPSPPFPYPQPPTPGPTPIFFFSSDRKLLSLSLPPTPPHPGLPPFFFPALIGNCYCYLPFCQLCDAGDRVTSGLDVLTWLPDNGMVTFETISNPTLSSFVI